MSTQKLATTYSITYASAAGTYTITWSATYPAITFGAGGSILYADPKNSNWIWFGDTTSTISTLTTLDWHQCTSPSSSSASGLVAAILAMNTGFVPMPFALALSGDVTSVGLTTTVALVGGSTAANVHTAEVAVNSSATSSATASTLAKRDTSGNCSFAQVNASAINDSGLTASQLLATDSSKNLVSGNLSGDVTSSSTTTTVALVGGSTAANVHTAEVAVNTYATPYPFVSTLVKRDAFNNVAFGSGTVTATNFAAPSANPCSVSSDSADLTLKTTTSGNVNLTPATGGQINCGTGIQLPNSSIGGVNKTLFSDYVVGTFSLTLSPSIMGGTPTACTAAVTSGSGLTLNQTYSYVVTFITSAGETLASVASNTVTPNNPNGQVNLTNIPLGISTNGVTGRNIYRTLGNGSTYYLLGTSPTIGNNTATTYNDNRTDTSILSGGVNPPLTDGSNSTWSSGPHTNTADYGRIGNLCWLRIVGTGASGSPGSQFYYAASPTAGILVSAISTLPTAITPSDLRSVSPVNIYSGTTGNSGRIDVYGTGALFIYATAAGGSFATTGDNGFPYDCFIMYHI